MVIITPLIIAYNFSLVQGSPNQVSLSNVSIIKQVGRDIKYGTKSLFYT